MARYIDADKLRNKVKTETNPYGKPTLEYESGVKVLAMIDNAPTADVVPKSEVEMLQGALKAEERHNELTMERAKKALANAKAEVAREIFEEIEKQSVYHFAMRTYGISELKFAELKKKYIPQDYPTCKHMVSCEPNVFGSCDEYEEENKNGKENT